MAIAGFDTSKFEEYIVSLIEKDRKKLAAIEQKGICLSDTDPFSALFECASLNITMEGWLSTVNSKS